MRNRGTRNGWVR